jgi:hypothetical protein
MGLLGWIASYQTPRLLAWVASKSISGPTYLMHRPRHALGPVLAVASGYTDVRRVQPARERVDRDVDPPLLVVKAEGAGMRGCMYLDVGLGEKASQAISQNHMRTDELRTR